MSPTLQLVELIFVPFVVRKGEFLDDDLGVNQTSKIDYQKRFPVIPMYSMCQEASVCRGSAWNENSESLQVDWRRETISHCNLIPLLEMLRFTHRIHLLLLLVDELVLVEIHSIRVARLVIPIFEHKHVAVTH